MKVQQLTVPSKYTGLPENFGHDTTDGDPMEKDIKVIALVKGEEQYVFLYDDENRGEAQRLLARFASCPELSFSWYDAAVLGQKMRQDNLQQTREKQRVEFPRYGISVPLDDTF